MSRRFPHGSQRLCDIRRHCFGAGLVASVLEALAKQGREDRAGQEAAATESANAGRLPLLSAVARQPVREGSAGARVAMAMVRGEESTGAEETGCDGGACVSESGMRLSWDSEPESACADRVRQSWEMRAHPRLLLPGLWKEGDVALGNGAKLRFAMYRLKTASRRVAEVLTALAEGPDTFAALSASLSAAARVFGHGEGTMRCWLARAGEHGERLHERHFRNLWLGHVQLDELVVQIGAKVGTCGCGWHWKRKPS